MTFSDLPDATEFDVDLVVIGAGGAGLPAAVAAAENGIPRVLVLEKRASVGGNAARAWGIFASESPVQKQKLVDARNDFFFKTIMEWSHWKADPAIWRTFIRKSGDTIRWLESKGLEFDLLRYYPGQEPPVWHVPEGRGAQMISVLSENCRELGVQMVTNIRCEKILRDESGSIIGVAAKKDEKEIVIHAGAVVIATGGFGGNPELLKKLCNFYDDRIHCFGIPHFGDGLLMGAEIGAEVEQSSKLLLEWPHVHGDTSSILGTLAREPYAVYVNVFGKRFMDETKGLHAFEAANALLGQPGRVGYILLDDRMRQRMEMQGAVLARGKDRERQRREMPGLEEQLISMLKTGASKLMVSDSWVEIANWIGTEPKVLQTTIEEYNSFCYRGYDPDFIKDCKYLVPLHNPPYIAIKGELIFLNTLGGLTVNEKMEVKDRKGNSIHGLYAAGADTGGWETDIYCDKLSGTALGFAVNSGRIAGENATNYIRLKAGLTTRNIA